MTEDEKEARERTDEFRTRFFYVIVAAGSAVCLALFTGPPYTWSHAPPGAGQTPAMPGVPAVVAAATLVICLIRSLDGRFRPRAARARRRRSSGGTAVLAGLRGGTVLRRAHAFVTVDAAGDRRPRRSRHGGCRAPHPARAGCIEPALRPTGSRHPARNRPGTKRRVAWPVRFSPGGSWTTLSPQPIRRCGLCRGSSSCGRLGSPIRWLTCSGVCSARWESLS